MNREQHGFAQAATARLLSRQDGLNGETVYAIWYEAGSVRIGKCGNQHPSQRLKQLQTRCALTLALLACTRDVTEPRAHQLYGQEHLRGGGSASVCGCWRHCLIGARTVAATLGDQRRQGVGWRPVPDYHPVPVH